MNMEEFNKNFPSFEKKYQEDMSAFSERDCHETYKRQSRSETAFLDECRQSR